jgi:hypothetical protein
LTHVQNTPRCIQQIVWNGRSVIFPGAL